MSPLKAILPPEQFWRHRCSIFCSPLLEPIGAGLDDWRSKLSMFLANRGTDSSLQYCSFLLDAQVSAPTKLESLWEQMTNKKERGPPQVKGFIHGSYPLPRTALGTSPSSPVGGLLPFPPNSTIEFLDSLSTNLIVSRTTSLGFAKLCSRLATCMAKSLNFLACAGWTDSPVCLDAPPTLSQVQDQSLRHLFSAAFHFLDIEVKPISTHSLLDNLRHMKLGYQGDVVTTRRPLVANKVKPAWPKPGKACLFPVVDFLPPELKDDLLDPERCLLPRDQWPMCPPSSKVHASSEEWYELVKYGAHIGLFGEVPEDQVFRNQHGELVLNGAMGVDKIKTIRGKEEMCLRFISNFIPINSYLRKLRGDSKLLPCVTQLGLLLLDDGELLQLESEDMESCFNLFYLPPAWAGYCAYEKKVPQSAFGGSPHFWSYVYMRAVPMGCTFAVDAMQCMARKYVFELCNVPLSTELRRDSPMPEDDISLVCLDGFDYIRKTDFSSLLGKGSLKTSEAHAKFVQTSHKLGLPLNAAKSLVKAFKGPILGGEVDGILGRVQHARDKGHKLMATTFALLSESKVTQASMQHWAGVACFAAGFRRPCFSILEGIFTFISDGSWSKYHLQHIPLDVVDEMLCFCGLLPLCYSNLRASIRNKISISDASEQGGGAAEASHFLGQLDPKRAEQAEDWQANICEEAASSLADSHSTICSLCYSSGAEWGTRAPCPNMCGAFFCSTTCLLQHTESYCPAPQLFLPCFGEGFCGPRAPLTWAVASSGTKVIKPFDKAYSPEDDFFSSEGKAGLQRFNQEGVAFEHWGPDCKLMSAARGKPIVLEDGSATPGPQAVRSSDYPMGLPTLRSSMRRRVRESNLMFMHSLRRLLWRVQNYGFGVVEHPLNSWGWWFPLALMLLKIPGVFFTVVWNCCHGGQRKKGTGLLHNCPQLHARLHSEHCQGHNDGALLDYSVAMDPGGRLVFDTEKEAEYPFLLCLGYAEAVQAALKEFKSTSIPSGISDQSVWMLDMLKHGSTKRLAEEKVSKAVWPVLKHLIRTMCPGQEQTHLRLLLRYGDFRGSDVILSSQEVLAEDRQLTPYPAFAWKWESVQSYAWSQPQHINVLEFTALLNYIRSIVKSKRIHSSRLFHILDSRVSSCILAKGRSSSRLLNRLCRRLTGFTLAADIYVLPLWTISKWNYSDAASRQVPEYAA